MHIALVAPLVSVIHDDLTPLGGAQAFVADLTHGLIDSGHQVTLLAADGSYIRGADMPALGIDASSLAPADFSQPGPRSDTVEQMAAFRRVRTWLEAHRLEINVAHGHAFDAPCFLSMRDLGLPVVHTLHLPPLDSEVRTAVLDTGAAATFVAVSEASTARWRECGVSIQRCIRPGLNLVDIPFRAEPGSYLLFAGRITPEKGPDQAIDIAASLGQSLILAGDVYDQQFFNQMIAPRVHTELDLDDPDSPPAGATYIGARSRSDLLGLMSRARGLLMPSTWDEPFGLVGIEAQATGTPVVAYRRGGLVEVVAHGETGWLVTPGDQAQFRARVSMLEHIDRHRCRQRIQEQFSMRRTVEDYVSLYDGVEESGRNR